MATHLTIDLDYWTCDTSIFGVETFEDVEFHSADPKVIDDAFIRAREHMKPVDRMAARVIRKVLQVVPDVIVVPYHHQIVAHLHAHPHDHIINIDYHSDLPEKDTKFYIARRKGRGSELNEGSWGLFVPDTASKVFEWRRPADVCMKEGYGGCHSCSEENPFKVRISNPYRKARSSVGLKGLPWEDITSASICLSMSWWGMEHNDIFTKEMLPETLKLLGIDYFQAKKLWHPYILKGKPKFNRPGVTKLCRSWRSRTDGKPLIPKKTLEEALTYP